jgi:hypothetical protein
MIGSGYIKYWMCEMVGSLVNFLQYPHLLCHWFIITSFIFVFLLYCLEVVNN